ncbi:MAG TPA: twitching motility protein PilT [Methanomassiliicoccaceae archaeon]|nr:twitching motility protein PilT [Methanomassiliicoccaceae archaeon]
MPVVVLDTNALLLPFERSVNIDSQLRSLLGNCEILVPGSLIGELRRSSNKHARAAIELAFRYKVVDTEATGDQAVIELAERHDAYVVTNDRALIARLREKRIKVILLRGGSHLGMDF